MSPRRRERPVREQREAAEHAEALAQQRSEVLDRSILPDGHRHELGGRLIEIGERLQALGTAFDLQGRMILTRRAGGVGAAVMPGEVDDWLEQLTGLAAKLEALRAAIHRQPRETSS